MNNAANKAKTISEDFKQELKALFLRGFEGALSGGIDESRWTVKEQANDEKIQEKEFFVLTVSSQLFRIFVMLHFTQSEQTENYVAETMKLPLNNLDSTKYLDFLGEVGNAFCGNIKRELNKTVPSLGMSTPNRLTRESLKYMKALKIDFESHAVAKLDDDPLFYASVYLSADESLDFVINRNRGQAEDEVDSGELEMF